MNAGLGKKQQEFEKIAALHVTDLFSGGPYAPPRRKIVAASAKKKPRRVVEPEIERVAPPTHYAAIKCPCCKHELNVPDVGVIIDHYRLPPMQAAILRAVWRGKGMPVMPERIFDAMYADDPDGGPSPASMYRAFKVTLCHLRKRLVGTGIAIENAGYRLGYRLVLGE